jgi:trans-2,3-dihydro-3-hydroxyanthranilate isomerase
VIPVSAQGDRWTLQANSPQWREVVESPGALAATLGLEAKDIGERPLWVSTGSEQLIVPLTSEDAVRRAAPRLELFTRFATAQRGAQAYVFAPRKGAVVAKRELLLSRFFFQQGPAVLEDPATGSATANLGGWYLASNHPRPCRFEIAQGEQCGRPSLLYLDVDADQRVRVSGDVVELGRGTITI